MAFTLQNGKIIIDSSGQPIDCATCACSSVSCTTTCDEGICCNDGPAEVLMTIPAATFGSSLCSTGDCTDLEGLHVLTQLSFPTTCFFAQFLTTGVNCGDNTLCVTTLTPDGIIYDWQMRFLSPNKVQVILRQAAQLSSGPPKSCANFADTYFHGSLPLLTDSLYDCSLSTPITCAFTSQDINTTGFTSFMCALVSTNATLTIEAN